MFEMWGGGSRAAAESSDAAGGKATGFANPAVYAK